MSSSATTSGRYNNPTLSCPTLSCPTLSWPTSKTVFAAAGSVVVESTHRCCAERVLLDKWVRASRRHGVPRYSVVAWVKRKLGGSIVVERFRTDSSVGCCVPCILCRNAIVLFDLRVTCTLASGHVFHGKLDDAHAPPSSFTRIQRRFL